MKKSALLCIIIASVGWGTSGIFVDILSPYGFTAMQMTFIRSLSMFALMLIYVLIHNRKLIRVSAKEFILIALGGLSFFGTASCYYYAMVKTSVSTAVVLMYTAPVFVMIYSVLFLGERLTKRKFVSVLGMLIGCMLVSGIIGGFRFDLVGIAFGFLSGLCYSAYNIFTKIQVKKGISPITANLYGFFCATLAGCAVAEISAIPMHMESSVIYTLSMAILMGIVTSVLPYLCYFTALKSIPAGTASSLAILEPMAATVFSVAFLGESLSFATGAGFVLILGSVVLLSGQKEN